MKKFKSYHIKSLTVHDYEIVKRRDGDIATITNPNQTQGASWCEEIYRTRASAASKNPSSEKTDEE